MRFGLLIMITGLIPLPWGWLTYWCIQKFWQTAPAMEPTDGNNHQTAGQLWDYQI